jgi:hypothetical protein
MASFRVRTCLQMASALLRLRKLTKLRNQLGPKIELQTAYNVCNYPLDPLFQGIKGVAAEIGEKEIAVVALLGFGAIGVTESSWL